MHRRVIMSGDLIRYWPIWPLIWVILLTACQTTNENNTIQELTIRPPVTKTTPYLGPAVAPILDQIEPSPRPSATVQPTPTPRQTITVATQERWAGSVSAALVRLNAQDSNWNWRQVTSEADISIEAGDHGQRFTTTTTALTVDFWSALESITSEEASDIILLGDDRIIVMEWTDVPPERKTLKVDGLLPNEPGYAFHQIWSFASAPEFEEAAIELAGTLSLDLQTDPIVKLAAVGDIMLDRALGYAIQQGQIDYPFALVAAVLSQADLTVGNLESALGASGNPANKSYTFQAPAVAAESLTVAGFDLVSLANNHAMDFGEESLLEGIELLNRQGIATIGAGLNNAAAHEPVILEVNGISIAFLGYVNVPVEVSGFDTRSWEATELSPGLAWAHLDDIILDVGTADQNADLVIVVLHSGYEYVETPSEPQQLAAKSAIDAGADLVIGHHAHVLQGIEFYNDGVIAYGLGNFAFEIDGDPTTAVLNVWLDRDGVRELEIIPAIIQFGGQTRLATENEATSIKERIYYLSRLLNRS
jgi:poly-gamma-glutamate capsule biosynthesis protein CapA/YwtB (metallophosphatase superfamily)